MRDHCAVRGHVAVAFLCVGLLATPCARAEDSSFDDLTKLSLEELLNIEVTSAAKRPQKLGDATSAIFVLTQEDIRRSGATSIPEALRMVPGLQVARIDANSWAITARGFASRFANKLLVLIDGRTVYTPLFSGVFWDRQDTMMEDVERIEIIRGPGAALWGANAVNGVINVITKHSKETQGDLASVAVGTAERVSGAFRHGGAIGDSATYRAYAKYFDRYDSTTASNGPGRDGWRYGRAGLRSDGETATRDTWTLDADAYRGRLGETFMTPSFAAPFISTTNGKTDTDGGHVLGRWNHSLAEGSDFTLQSYYDRTGFSDPRLSESRDTADVQLEHRLAIAERHEVVWGAGYRVTHDDVNNSAALALIPTSRTAQLLSAFGQDTVTIVADRFYLTGGAKIEYNTYTSVEFQPTARLLWTPNASESVWTAVSRAVRTPSRAEEDVRLISSVLPPGAPGNPSPLPLETLISGSHALRAETLTAYEVGYRLQATSSLSFDLAGFYNDYRNLLSEEPGAPTLVLSPVPHFVVPLTAANKLHGDTYGLELVSTWQPRHWWRLQGSYTFLKVDLRRDADSLAPAAIEAQRGQSPRHQFGLRSLIDVTSNVSFDSFLRYVDALPSLGVPRYVELNLRLGWRPVPNVELAIVGESLIRPAHLEFGSETLPVVPTRVERAVLFQTLVKF
ncbi:MAG: TonB-dependent receptor plug domain-containing protein [Proteobacteria bacterium]|nr:TonB-dependent receptor plug domain-containing protein [Pseudomonadota bacterium]MBI3496997.1 TonB-dependent receptor plug domain-containing protein [Pseudomonadota bacterium]